MCWATPNLGYALAFGMIVITALANTCLYRAARAVGKVAEMTRFLAWGAFLAGCCSLCCRWWA
jgi:hypothetical protein